MVRKSDNWFYALKQVSWPATTKDLQVKISKLSEREKLNALNEVRILASIEWVPLWVTWPDFSDRNIIAYKEAFFDEDSSTLCIVMEYADGGDLYRKIIEHKKNQTTFTERDIWDCLI